MSNRVTLHVNQEGKAALYDYAGGVIEGVAGVSMHLEGNGPPVAVIRLSALAVEANGVPAVVELDHLTKSLIDMNRSLRAEYNQYASDNTALVTQLRATIDEQAADIATRAEDSTGVAQRLRAERDDYRSQLLAAKRDLAAMEEQHTRRTAERDDFIGKLRVAVELVDDIRAERDKALAERDEWMALADQVTGPGEAPVRVPAAPMDMDALIAEQLRLLEAMPFEQRQMTITKIALSLPECDSADDPNRDLFRSGPLRAQANITKSYMRATKVHLEAVKPKVREAYEAGDYAAVAARKFMISEKTVRNWIVAENWRRAERDKPQRPCSPKYDIPEHLIAAVKHDFEHSGLSCQRIADKYGLVADWSVRRASKQLGWERIVPLKITRFRPTAGAPAAEQAGVA
jgi:hypothetical protein